MNYTIPYVTNFTIEIANAQLEFAHKGRFRAAGKAVNLSKPGALHFYSLIQPRAFVYAAGSCLPLPRSGMLAGKVKCSAV
jgi:hypothetical protein